MYADFYYDGGGALHYKCNVGGYHGNYGTVGFSQVFYDFGGINEISCASVSVRNVYVYNGNVFNAARAYVTSVGGSGQSTAPGANRPILGSNYYATRAGVYDYVTPVDVFGC